MLILARRQFEKIVIDGHIVVEVLSIRGDSVRLGITAPRSIQVHREEVQLAVDAENRRQRLRHNGAGEGDDHD